jgi:hypothetical protein
MEFVGDEQAKINAESTIPNEPAKTSGPVEFAGDEQFQAINMNQVKGEMPPKGDVLITSSKDI